MDPEVHRELVSPEQAVAFRSTLYTPSEATHALIELDIPDPDMEVTMEEFSKAIGDLGSVKNEDAPPSPPESISLLDVASLSSASELGWQTQFDEGFDTKSWAPFAREHRSTLILLRDLVGNLEQAVPKIANKIDTDIRSGLKSTHALVAGLTKDSEILAGTTGDLTGIVAEYESVAGALNSLLSQVMESRSAVSSNSIKIDDVFEAVNQANNALEEGTTRMLRVITKVSRNSSTRLGLMEERIAALEGSRLRIDTGVGSPGQSDGTEQDFLAGILGQDSTVRSGQAPPVHTHSNVAAPNIVDGNTVFGSANVGGNTVDLTVNSLFAMVQKLETQQAVIMNRSKSNSVLFHNLAFSSELEFIRFYTSANPAGSGSAAFVDLISIWAFASLEQVTTTDWLQTYHRSVSTGFTNNLETKYANSMNNRYPVPFVGSAELILSTQIIKMFESLDAWKGSGMGDGNKERLVESMRMGVSRHRTYCMDNLLAGPLREHALKSAEFTLDFFQGLVAHVDDEISMLVTFNLPSKQIMLLVSSQVVQICDELFDFRQHAINVDASNKTSMAARFGWVTLQALQKMDGYFKNRFKHDPAITGTFTRFLTRQMAATTTAGLSTSVATLETGLRNLKNSAATKDALSKLDNKVEGIVDANNLKKKRG